LNPSRNFAVFVALARYEGIGFVAPWMASGAHMSPLIAYSVMREVDPA